jgi:large subunit ribosomal protein L5
MATLKEKYQSNVIKEMARKFSYKNQMEIPRLVKVVVNRGVTEATQDGKAIDVSAEELALICGQRPLRIKSRKAIATFKLRQGLPIGLKVTLRGERMYHFMDKLVNLCLPKIRDFKGLNPKSFDGRGNFSLGIKEQLIFPEVKYDKVDRVRGMDIIIQTSAKTDAEAKELLSLLGVPFKKEEG